MSDHDPYSDSFGLHKDASLNTISAPFSAAAACTVVQALQLRMRRKQIVCELQGMLTLIAHTPFGALMRSLV